MFLYGNMRERNLDCGVEELDDVVGLGGSDCGPDEGVTVADDVCGEECCLIGADDGGRGHARWNTKR